METRSAAAAKRANAKVPASDALPEPDIAKILKKKRLAAASSDVDDQINTIGRSLKASFKNPRELWNLANELLFNSNYVFIVAAILIPLELLVNCFIVYKIPYTEIDWVAYMQEVEGFMNGTLNYYELKGDTGPLVYPAGFVYIYSLFYSVTNLGKNIRFGQFIFIGIYMVFITIVFSIYRKTKRVPPIALLLMSLTSHRIHSIFVLRLFNDPIAMLLFYASISALLSKHVKLGCVLYSLAVSVKMNVLLFAPGLFVLLVLSQGLTKTIKLIILCGLVQLALGAPFLLTFPVAYIHRSFDLGRQFFFKWTVNWKFLPEDVFLAKPFQLALLALHLILLVLFLNKLLRNVGGLKAVILPFKRKTIKLSADFVIFTMFLTNFIGICFSRSLHYQFYVWYYHTFAYLLWSTNFSNKIRILLFGLVELCWNVYPSTFYSSIALNVCHLTVLFGLWRSLDAPDSTKLIQSSDRSQEKSE